jgi:hypothetical protein
VVDVIFPSVVGVVVRGLRAGLPGVLVQPKLPAVKTARMVTIRDDSGPDDGTQSRRRIGVNVWADSPSGAEDLALLAMAVLRKLPDGKPVTAVDQLSGPFEIFDEGTDVYTVSGKTLIHYYFTGRVSVRGTGF